MTFYFNLLNNLNEADIAVKHLRGLIGEEIVAYLLRKRLNFCVVRPSQLISSLEALSLKSKRYEFLVHYAKTMDFFGVWPSILNLFSDHFGDDSFRTSVMDIFTGENLAKTLASQSSVSLKGFVIEVKSSMIDNHSRAKVTSRQTKMMRISRKLGFGNILAHVIFLHNYQTRVRLFDDNNVPINPMEFALS